MAVTTASLSERCDSLSLSSERTILVPPAAPLGRLSESTTETTRGETHALNALRATEGVLH